MAHGDYECCAVCDCKMSYGEFDNAKTDICASCAAALALQGVVCRNVTEFNQWLNEVDIDRGKKILKEVGFSKCFYDNETDEIYHRRFEAEPPAGAAEERRD